MFKPVLESGKMLRVFILLLLLTMTASFAPFMSSGNQNLKKELYSTRSKLLYGPKDKLIYVATFTKNGILIRPKRVYIRKTKSCAINRILQNIKRFVTMIFRVIKH